MMSRSLAVGLLAAGCLAAAAGGAYLSVQEQTAATTVAPVAGAAAVSETEALVAPSVPPVAPNPAPEVRVEERVIPVAPTPEPAPRATRAVRKAKPEAAVPAAPSPVPDVVHPAAEPRARETAAPAPAVRPAEEAPAAPPAPRFDDVVIPASAVIGFEIESTLTSERTELEERVAARVARDVYSEGRLVIPAGTRALGIVTEVDRGGKVKERARLGVRFHTLVLADGRHLEIQTDTIYREGESPANDSSKKIGGAAIGGAVLGAIMGGKKGAIIGGAAGAAGGTAAVMAGGRNGVTLPAGTVLTARLASPLTVEVERR